jgi:2-methylaconitate cis-trans-isomerase PrpF
MSRGRRVKAVSFELSGVPEDENIVDLEWIGECDATADELLNGGKSLDGYDDEPFYENLSKVEEAMRFLSDNLSETPMDKEDIVNAAKAQGIKYETLRRAREKLGVITDPQGNRSWWSLPQSDD